MKKVTLEAPPEQSIDDTTGKVIALGYFDGVHIGHQKVIKTAVRIAREKGLEPAVMTFHPHPSTVIPHLKSRNDYLTPPDEKAKRIADLGIKKLYQVKFDQDFSQLSPQAFIDNYIIALNTKHVVAGFDFTYGKKAAGSMETIGEHSRGTFDVTTISKVVHDGEKISTSGIRELLQTGQAECVLSSLGRYYQLSGTVIHGDKRGRTLGFPTANVQCHEPYIVPKKGIYAVKFVTENHTYNGLCNVGTRPTFYRDSEPVSIEVYVLDFDGDLYGETVDVVFQKRLRDELKFDSVDELIDAMNDDKENAIRFFAREKRSGTEDT